MARESVVSGRIDVEGLKAMNRSLKSLEVDKTEIIQGNVEAAETLIRAARPLVPKRTGALVNTLKPARIQTAAEARAGLAYSVDYANPIHWGWSIVGELHKGKLRPGTIRNIKPQPFFAQALHLTKDEIIADYVKTMQRLIDKYGLGDN